MDLSIQTRWDLPADFATADGSMQVGQNNHGARLLRDCLTENYHRLHRRLLRYVGCADLAGDCLHDAWLRLGEMAVPEKVAYPQAYVYRVACNLALDRLRGDRTRHVPVEAVELDAVVDPAPGPEQIAQDRSALAAVERAMQALPYQCGSVLFDLRVDGLTRPETALRHGLSLRRVDTVLRRTLAHCAAQAGRAVPAEDQPVTK